MVDLSQLRQEYGKLGLSEADANTDPIEQFQNWFHEAVADNLVEPHAMVLSTVSPEGKPSSRVVLLRHVSHEGFTFFTNYLSRKGIELNQNHAASLLFFWGQLERQVRVEGHIVKTDSSTSDEYFSKRPRDSQLAAVISAQSKVVESRKVLEDRMTKLSAELDGKPVPRPEHWGGYILIPESIEFWQGRPSRLHDRLRYRKVNNRWLMERLSP